MQIFYIFAGVALIGIVYVVWSLFNDKGSDAEPEASSLKVEKLIPDHLFDHNKKPEINLTWPSISEEKKEIKKANSAPKLGSLFKGSRPKLNIEKPKTTSSNPKTSLFKKLFSKKQKISPLEDDELSRVLKAQLGITSKETNSLSSSTITPTGTSAIKTSTTPISPKPAADSLASTGILSKDEEKKIEKEINSSLELSELKSKFERLDNILAERNKELESTKHDLDNEVRHRKEFNKVKDLLEKELAETKDKARKSHNELISTQAESESHRKRITQLEDKITSLEKQLYGKEKEIEDLAKKLNQKPPTPMVTPVLPPQEPVAAAPKPALKEEPSLPLDSTLKDPWTAKEATPEAIQTEAVKLIKPKTEEELSENKTEFLSLKPDVMEPPDKKTDNTTQPPQP